MKLATKHNLLFVLAAAASYSVLFLLPISSFPKSFSKSIYSFQLPPEHKLITYSEYSVYVWLTALILPFVALTLQTVQHQYHVFFVIFTSFLIFLVVYPQAYSFSNDAEPLPLKSSPSWNVYMAVYVPPSVLLGLQLHSLKKSITSPKYTAKA